MAAKTTTTVTHTDGTVSKRTSASRKYTHAIEISPAPAEKFAAYLIRQAAEREAYATRLEQAAEREELAAELGRVLKRAEALRKQAAEVLSAGAPIGKYMVARWSSSYALASKALNTAASAVEQGYTVRVVPVDAA